MSIKVGDVVAIRGDKRVNMNGQCAYTDDQLVCGKYLRHSGHGGIWTGVVSKVSGDLALVEGGWRGVERYELIMKNRGGK